MQKLNTTLVYILSVVGILCCCVYGIGTISAIIAIIVASKELKKYHANPEDYVNGKAMKTAKTVAIVALVISFIGLGFIIWFYMNQCEFFNWYLDMFADNPNVTEEQLAPVYQAMEEAGCM